jgi:hypothetical protein
MPIVINDFEVTTEPLPSARGGAMERAQSGPPPKHETEAALTKLLRRRARRAVRLRAD